jgi:hypothetical protein
MCLLVEKADTWIGHGEEEQVADVGLRHVL